MKDADQPLWTHEHVSKDRCPKCKQGFLIINDAGSAWCDRENDCDYVDL